MNRLRVFVCLVMLVFSVPSLANGNYTGTISRLTIVSGNGNLVFIELTGTKTGNPSCGTSATFGYVMNLGTNPQNQMYLMLMAARAANASVVLQGTGACGDYSSVESLATVYY